MLQSIIVYLVLIACLIYVGNRVACFFKNDKGSSDKCATCAGCALKDLKTKKDGR